MGLAGHDRDAHRRHARRPAPPAARAPAQHPAHHAGKPRAAALARRTRPRCLAGSPASSWTRCTRSPAPSAATSSHSASPGSPRSRPARAGSACPRPSRTRARCSPMSARTRLIEETDGAPPALSVMLPEGRLPWSGHMGLDSAPEVMERIRAATMTIVFVNTRAQAEMMFQALWKLNADTLPIALHHGSLDIAQRRRVEAAMADGQAARRGRHLLARSRHRLGRRRSGDPGRRAEGRLAPAATGRPRQPPHGRGVARDPRARQPFRGAGVRSRRARRRSARTGRRPAAAGRARRAGAASPAAPLAAHRSTPTRSIARSPAPRRTRGWRARDFDDVLGFVENGGYALAAYERYRKLFRDSEGRVHVRSERVARQARMNIGTIVEAPMLQDPAGRQGSAAVRCSARSRSTFVNMLRPATPSCSPGACCSFLRLHETVVEVAEGGAGEPMVPAYAGARMPLTTNLADRVRAMLQDRGELAPVPRAGAGMAAAATIALPPAGPRRSAGRDVPARRSLVPRRLLLRGPQRAPDARHAADAADGAVRHGAARLRRDRLRARARGAPTSRRTSRALFEQDMLGDDLEAWMADSSMLRRTFRNVAVIAGLIERNHPGAEKTRRQVTVNSDLIYDVLRRHQPDHILLRATRADAAGGLIGCGPHRRHARAHQRTDHAHGAVARLAAGGAGAAGYRPRKRAQRRAMRKRCSPKRRRSSQKRPATPSRRRAAMQPAPVPAVHRANVGAPVAPAGQASLFGRIRERRADPPRGRAADARSAGRPVLAGRADCLPSPTCTWRKARPSPGRGMLLPPWDTHGDARPAGAAAAALASAHRRRAGRQLPRRARARRGSPASEAARLDAMTRRTRVHLGAGQPRSDTAGGIGGRFVEALAARAARVPPSGRRGARAGEICRASSPESGSPGARLRRSAAPASSRTARRLMLPAFGAYTGGLDVAHPRSARCSRAAAACSCSGGTGCSASR